MAVSISWLIFMAKWHSIQDILKNILQLSANTHHDVAVFEVDGIYKKHNISRTEHHFSK